jgi:hypothetical protein
MKTPELPKVNPSVRSKRNFTGTTNPRHLRAITVLMRRPILRKQLDDVAGCTNAPALIAELRSRGLEIPCERISFLDRDGRCCHPGVYSFTASDRRRINRWIIKDRKLQIERGLI